MYGRYFMWNFVGRQTLNQGFGGKTSGEWVSGIKFIDEARLGPQDMPDHMKNKGNNKSRNPKPQFFLAKSIYNKNPKCQPTNNTNT